MKTNSNTNMVLETMEEGVVIQNYKGEIEQFNSSALRILALTEDQLLGRSSMDPEWRSIKEDGSDFPGDQHPAMEALRTGNMITGVVMGLRLPAGHVRWIRITAKPYYPAESDHEKINLKVLCTFFDITEMKERNEEIRYVLDSLKIGVWKFNPSDSSLYWDKSMYKLFDISENEFSGHYQAWEKSLTPEGKDKAVAELEAALKGEKEFNTVFEIQTRSSGKRWISARGKVVRDSEGKPIMMYGINVDSTEDIRVETELKRLLDENLAILKSTNFAIITTSMDGIITGFNEEAERLLGFSAQEVIGKLTPEIFHDKNEVADLVEALSKENGNVISANFEALVFKARQGLHDERQWTYISKNGQRTQVKLSVTALKSKNGSVYGFMGVAKDITQELKIRSELELERAKALTNAKLASLGEMAAGVAHEINNPLAIIDGAVDLLPKYRENAEKFPEKIRVIKNAIHRISRIVKSLRKFSRSDVQTIFETHSLTKLLDDALILLDTQAKRHDINIQLEKNSISMICCDEVEIQQVLINLINNAIDAIKNNSDRWIKISVFDQGNEVVLRVMDSGEGIPPKVLEKLFDPFFTTKKVGEGTGLGLSISKGIIDNHNATITVLKDLPNTCFEIRFPVVAEGKK